MESTETPGADVLVDGSAPVEKTHKPLPAAWNLPVLALGLLGATHFLVDTVAATVNPLWPRLEEDLQMGQGGIVWVYVSWMAATSFSQLLFGACADRFSMRWLIWLGPAVAIISLSCIGFAPDSLVLTLLFVVGGLGIASFHPEGAAYAGSLLPQHRSRAMAVFALSGYMGQAVGPYYSGFVTKYWGLTGLSWGMCWFGGALVVLAVSLSLSRRKMAAASVPISKPKPASKQSRPPASLLTLLLTIGALRILPALGVPFVLAFLLTQRGAESSVIGAVQSAFMAGTGFGAMFCAALVHRRDERKVITVLPLCAAPVLLAMVAASGWYLVGLVGLAGILLGITMPVYISYGQQLIPNGQRIASSITMGVSWGLGGALNAGLFRVFQIFDALNWMFVVFACSSVLSSILCQWLPQTTASDGT